MNIVKINEVLKNFIMNKETKSILIDGPWGCGKTYQINEFMKKFINNKTNKIYYLSLFGLESIDEIHTTLYYQLHPNKKTFKKISKKILNFASIISKAIPFLDKVVNVCDSLDAQLRITPTGKIKKSSIIIFDDLERISTSINYTNFLGYINNLLSLNCKIICLVNSQGICNDVGFSSFREKVFDNIYTISETNTNLLHEMFDKFEIHNINSTFELFCNNLRMARRVELFYNKIIEIFKNNNTDIKKAKHSEYIIFKAAIYTVLIAFKEFKYEEINEMENLNYNSNKKIYGESVANGWEKYFNAQQNDFEMNTIGYLTEMMLRIFMFDDKSFFENYFSLSTKNKDNSILNEEFLYLSDNNKIIYLQELEKTIQYDDFILEDNVYKISAVIKYSDFSFNKLSIKKIAKSYVNEFGKDLESISFYLRLDDVKGEKLDSIKSFINNITIEAKNLIIEEDLSNIQKFNKTNDYNGLYDFIISIFDKSNTEFVEKINKYLIEENFCIPDLANNITKDEWEYSHLIAKYARKNNLGDIFISVAKNICSKNFSNKSLIDRYYLLIKHNIDNNIKIEDLQQN